MKTERSIRLFLILIFGGLMFGQAAAQTPTPSAPEPRKTGAATQVNPLVVENVVAAPQVVTILHRLNGLKIFRLLLRSGEEVGAIANFDEAFQIAGEVHTNVIAGLALDDGHTIAAWLPEAGAEMPPPAIPFGPRAPAPPKSSMAATQAPKELSVPLAPPISIPGLPPSMPFAGNLLEPVDLKIITRDGRRFPGRYVGLDGLTGLSVISLTNGDLPQTIESHEETIKVGQRLRLIGPEPALHTEASTRSAMYVRMGETEAVVVNVSRSPSGGLARVRIKSAKLSPANIGGIAINDAGETLGIVDAVEGGEATIVPLASVRSAAKRVIARQSSVPRPWLGIRGEPIVRLSVERILGVGWQPERARALTEKRRGILLTSVAPGSPAALAHLKPGDVILNVNNGEVRNADDFSWLLEEAGAGTAVHFTVARPGKPADEAFEIKLGESPDPLFGLRMFQDKTPKIIEPGSLMAQGIETIAIKQRAASRLGANGGLLVVYVQPSTAAFRAGLRPGDVIEAINGQEVLYRSASMPLLNGAGESSTFKVVRNKQKIVLTFQNTIR